MTPCSRSPRPARSSMATGYPSKWRSLPTARCRVWPSPIRLKCLNWRARHAQHAAVLPSTVVAQVVARTRALLERPRGLLDSAVHGVSQAPEVRRVRRPVARAISNRFYRHISRTYCAWNVKFSQELAEDSPFRTWQWHVHARCDTAPERSTSSALMTCVSWGVINRRGCVDSPASFSTETVA